MSHFKSKQAPVSFQNLRKLKEACEREMTPLDDSVPFRATTNHSHATWARTFHSHPALYIQPESITEVQQLVLRARSQKQRIVVTGASHSPSDLTCTSSWLVSLKKLDRVLDVQKDEKTGEARVTAQAGISLHELSERLSKSDGLIIPNLGSIDVQSIAGAIATATHGSSLYHGLLAQNIHGMRICLADGSIIHCSPTEREDLFRAALVSLGAIGIIVEVELRMIRTCNVEWTQDLVSVDRILENWDQGHWTQAEFVRCWWLPYQRNMVVWKANKTDKSKRFPKQFISTGSVGFYFYKCLLWFGHFFPRALPIVETIMFGLNNGRLTPGHISDGVDEQRSALLMDCLFSQFVNEWAIPLHKGPEAIIRLEQWLLGQGSASRIPFDPRSVFVHYPIEVRVTDNSHSKTKVRGYLDPSMEDGPTLYLNATLYRPFGLDPPSTQRYYEAFEWLMRDLGGRPHWAKNFQTVSHPEFRAMYGKNLSQWQQVREKVDPQGMFIGAWHTRNVLDQKQRALSAAETELYRKPYRGGGMYWKGTQAKDFDEQRQSFKGLREAKSSPSDESFDSFATSVTESEEIISAGGDHMPEG